MAITSENAGFWQALANDLEAERPSVGKSVFVARGRKHAGKFGRVVRHQVSRYTDAYRYASDAQAHMRDMRGTWGWVCQIAIHGSGELVWVRADYVTIASPIDGR